MPDLYKQKPSYENQCGWFRDKEEETRLLRVEDTRKHAPDIFSLGRLVNKFSTPGEAGAACCSCGTASLVAGIGGEDSKRFVIITAAHNFVQTRDEETLEWSQGKFIL